MDDQNIIKMLLFDALSANIKIVECDLQLMRPALLNFAFVAADVPQSYDFDRDSVVCGKLPPSTQREAVGSKAGTNAS